MKRYTIKAMIAGECTLVTYAENQEQAIRKFEEGKGVSIGSNKWEIGEILDDTLEEDDGQ